jgi:hypothetical protein
MGTIHALTKSLSKEELDEVSENLTVECPLSKKRSSTSKRLLQPLPDIELNDANRHIVEALPTAWEPWPDDKASVNPNAQELGRIESALRLKGKKKAKIDFPKRPVVFISDPHADAEAFEASLVASGVVAREVPGLCNLVLTKLGKKSEVIIGGDCLDKGPSNLALLRSVHHLYRIGARVTLIAGNHDLRLLMGLLSLERPHDVGNQHFFVRMGKKVVPLLKEVFVNYLDNTDWDTSIPDEQTCHDKMFPGEEWFEKFPFHAAGVLTDEGVEREMRKMRNKTSTFTNHCADHDLTLRQVYAAALKCQQLFLHDSGEFAWFFKNMKLVDKRGSFLFLHAGIDDAMSALLKKKGVKHANKAFHYSLRNADLFSFYYGSIANTFRTKYRKADLPLTSRGVKSIKKFGVNVLVQGHVNRIHGQRLTIKRDLVHIEGDITLDKNSREQEGILDTGVGYTLVSKEQGIVGVSNDYPVAKVYHPKIVKLRNKRII